MNDLDSERMIVARRSGSLSFIDGVRARVQKAIGLL
jgi:hypothetical protein